MQKFYACVISPDVSRDKTALIAVAGEFAHAIEVLADGVLFDVSGLTRLIGDGQAIERNIVKEMQQRSIAGRVAVAENAETATLLARSRGASELVNPSTNLLAEFTDIPLDDLDIDTDTLNVFHDLGINCVRDLLAVPTEELVKRYGREFERVVQTIRQKGKRMIVPNVKETDVSWSYELDFAVHNFEQLIFVTGRGLDKLFAKIAYSGLSTEQIDITLNLRKQETKLYEIKTSFPSLEKAFWLKLINLRIALDPPESEIVSVRVVAHFTKPRPDQRGLYAVSRPEPESLLLTINKLKKLVGESEVGVPVLLNQRLARPFALDGTRTPSSALSDAASRTHVEKSSTLYAASGVCKTRRARSVIAFNYFRPMIRASVTVRDRRLVHLKTRLFSGSVTEYSGVWRANSRWWDRPWSLHEWDVEIESHGVYRLRLARQEWFLVGEYD